MKLRRMRNAGSLALPGRSIAFLLRSGGRVSPTFLAMPAQGGAFVILSRVGEAAGHGSGATDSGCSYQDLVGFLE